MCRRGARRAHVIAITSGKGGVGKSNIAVNTSICLAVRGSRVTLVDVDLGLANSDVLLGMQPRHTLSHVISGTESLEEVCVRGPAGLRFVPGASGLGELADLSEFDRQSLLSQLETLEDSTDIVVLDCGAGISRNVMTFAASADTVVVVTTPQPTAVTDAYATIKVLLRERFEGRVGLFVNMADSRLAAAQTYERIANVAQKFLNLSVADLGYMVHDTAVARAVDARCPFVIRFPDCNASACVAALAETLSRSQQPESTRMSFFRRVVGIFG